MSNREFLIIWAVSFAVILACRVIPNFALRGRALPQGAVDALGYIPPAAFAALVANDLLSPGTFSAGAWSALMPMAAAAIVVAVAWKTNSMLWCCTSGVVAYLLLSLI